MFHVLLALLSTLADPPVSGAGGPGEHAPDVADDLTGLWIIGWRFVDVEGSESRFEEDLNLDAGLLLRAFRLEGRGAAAGSLESFFVDAHDVGDPRTAYRAEARAQSWKATASFDRDIYVGSGDGAVHAIDLMRERGRLRFETAPGRPEGWNGGIGLDYSHRDGFSIGTRSVDFGFVSGVPVRREDESLGVSGDLGFDLAGFDVEIEGGIDRAWTEDRRNFAAPSPSDPSALQTEDFRADGTATNVHTGARVSRAFAEGRVQTDVGFELARSDGVQDLASFETGILFDPAAPFERTVDADADVRGRSLELDGGVRWQAREDLAWRARAWRTAEEEGGELERHTLLNEFGSGTSEFDEHIERRVESRIEAAEIGFEKAFAATVELDLSLQAGLDHERITSTQDGVAVISLDETFEQLGGEAVLSIEPSRTLDVTLSGGYRVVPTNTPFSAVPLVFEDERGRNAALRVRWKPGAGFSLTSSVRHQARDIDAFGTDAASDSLSFAAAFAPSPNWNADLSYTLRHVDLSADTTIVLIVPPPEQMPAVVRYEQTQSLIAGSLACRLGARFEPRASASLSVGNGDAAFHLATAAVDLPYRLRSDWTIGLELEQRHFTSELQVGADDYDATLAFVYVAMHF